MGQQSGAWGGVCETSEAGICREGEKRGRQHHREYVKVMAWKDTNLWVGLAKAKPWGLNPCTFQSYGSGRPGGAWKKVTSGTKEHPERVTRQSPVSDRVPETGRLWCRPLGCVVRGQWGTDPRFGTMRSPVSVARAAQWCLGDEDLGQVSQKRREVDSGRISSPSRRVSLEKRQWLEPEVRVKDHYAAEMLGIKIILVQIPYMIMMREARTVSKINVTEIVS